MQTNVPQSTSFTWVFKLYLNDHVTPATLKTVAVTISKNTGAFGNPSGGATNATEIANGWYFVTFSTTDTGTLGPLIILGTCTGCDNADQAYQVIKATNAGLTAIPDTAVTTNASLITSGTGTDQLSVSAGKVLLQATQTGVTIPTVTTVTNQLTTAQIATGIWQDATAGDFTVASSIGKSLYTAGNAPGAASGLALVGSNMGTVTGVTGLTTAAIATAVWQDATAGDFTVASSIGKSLYTTGNAPGAASGLALVGSNMGSVSGVTGLTTATITTAVWSAALPGSYTSGMAGYIIGTGILAAITSGTAQAGSATAIQLASSASSATGAYVGAPVYITSGTGAGQAPHTIIDYAGGDKWAIIDRPWAIMPDNTSTYLILTASTPALNSDATTTAGLTLVPVQSGTASGGASSTITLSGASTTNDFYRGCSINILSGTGTGQIRMITGYVGSTGVATVESPWIIIPDTTSLYSIVSVPGLTYFSNIGVATAGSGTTITLEAAASATDHYYEGCFIAITGGTGSGQAKEITGYVGSTKVATVASAWSVNPDATSAYAVFPSGKLMGGTFLTPVNVISWAGVTVSALPANFGNLVIDTSGRVSLNLTQNLAPARALDGIADTSMIMNDVFHASIASAAGLKDASGGTTYIISTPGGTVLRSYSVTLIPPPSNVPDKIV
jgi:hypothetical protein